MEREKVLEIYREVIASLPEVELKGKTMPYTSANGHMFSQLNKEGQLGIRLAKEAGEDFIVKYDSAEFRSYGAVMKEYVLITEDLLTQPQVIAEYLIKGYQYVMTLPPK